MNQELISHASLILLGVFISCIAQVLLKIAAMKHYDSIWKEYLNPLVIIAYGIFFMATFLSIFAYRVVPLSMGAMLESTGYLYGTIFAVTIFKEKFNRQKVGALMLILAGIGVYALLG